MKAAKLYGPGDFLVVECPIPEINEHEILLKTKCAAICGSDLRMIGNGYAGVDKDHPLTLGHEVAGIIEKTGAAVTEYQAGMRISVAPNMGCGICDYCIEGSTHLCPDYKAFGINMDGGFAEYMRIPEAAITQGNILKLADHVTMEEGAILEPASCVKNGQEQVEIKINDTVLVVGAGPIGIMHAMLAKTSGAGKVLVSDLSARRLEMAEKTVPGIIPVLSGQLEETVGKLTGGKGLDVCIAACPSAAIQEQSLRLMGINGRILYFGGLPAGKDQITISSNLIHYKQLRICGSTRGNVRQYRDIEKMVANGILKLNSLITASYDIGHIAEAVESARSGNELKTVIHFS